MKTIDLINPLDDVTRSMSKKEKKEFIRVFNEECNHLMEHLVVALANIKRYGVLPETKDDLFKRAVANIMSSFLPLDKKDD